MYDINARAATNGETQILKSRLGTRERFHALHCAAAAAFACLFVFIVPILFDVGAATVFIISLLIFVFSLHIIFDDKNIVSAVKKNIARDIRSGYVHDIAIKDAIMCGVLEFQNASFFCFVIGDKKILIINSDVVDDKTSKHRILESSDDGEPDFPTGEFIITMAPESGVALSIKTAEGGIDDRSYSAKFSEAECHRECEIIDAAPDEFMKNPGEKYFTYAYESVNINNRSIAFNELAGILSGGFVFYAYGFSAAHGAAFGWAASYALTLLMILAFDGLNRYDTYMRYLVSELKPWQYGEASRYGVALKSFFVIINTALLFAIVFIIDTGLPYYQIIAASLAVSIISLTIPFSLVSSSNLSEVYLTGYHHALQRFFMTAFLMLLICLADKQRKIGTPFLRLFVGSGRLDESAAPMALAVRKTPVSNTRKLYLRYAFSILTALLIIAYYLPALPDIVNSYSNMYFKKNAIGNFSSPADAGRDEKTSEIGVSGIKFVYIPAGSFVMGGADPDARHDEKPVHKVTISKGFYLSSTEITQGQWKAVMGKPAPCKHKGDGLPVESVSWNDCMDFVDKMNEIEKKKIYRLPTEAEWEYACRANSPRKYCFGDDTAEIDQYAWHVENSNNAPHPAGLKKPNAWGLYDMHANVWEWCQDNYERYMPFELVDPRGPVLNILPDDKKVIRGGSWFNSKDGCTCSNRDAVTAGRRSSDIGMRLLKIDDGGAVKY